MEDQVRLNFDVLDHVFNHAVKILPIKDLLRLKDIHPRSNRAVKTSLARHVHIRLAFEEECYRISGIQREAINPPLQTVWIQGSRMSTVEEARWHLLYLLSSCNNICRLSISVNTCDMTLVEELLSMIVASSKARLHVLQVSRRDGVPSLPQLSRLIKSNEDTLRIIGRIGLSEATECLTPKLNLDRLSLMTGDLNADCSPQNIMSHFIRIQETGAHFHHLSYTSFDGFDPTDEVVQSFLDACGVCSLRLTMTRGPYIVQQPDYMVGKVRKVEHLELGEIVDKPNIINTLVRYEKIFQKVFPNVEHITFFQHWNQ